MRLHISDLLIDVYEDGILKKGEKLEKLLEYIPTKNGKHKNGIFVKDGKIIRKNIKIGDPVWNAIDPILGSTEDENIAWFFGIPTPIITLRRESQRVLPYKFIQWSIIEPLFNLASDEEIAELLKGSISLETLKERRKYLKDLGLFDEE